MSISQKAVAAKKKEIENNLEINRELNEGLRINKERLRQLEKLAEMKNNDTPTNIQI